jgi:Xaa-Pro aminopeptidase
VRERVDRLRGSLSEPLLVTDPVNVRYLCGLESSNAILLVDPERVQLFTDFRYAQRAQAIRWVDTVVTRRDLYGNLAELLTGRIAFESPALSHERYTRLVDAGIELVPTRGLVQKLREVKDDGELAAVRRAGAIVDDAFRRLADEPFVGRTERELAWRMVELMHELGAEEVSFSTVVAAGETGSSPHAVPGDRRVEAGETVVIDSGCKVNGYCSDCTRTFAAGSLPGELERAYDAVLRAQLAGLEQVRPGADGVAVDRVARSIIEEAGFGDDFGHGLGHGVGLEVHEAPWLNPEMPSTLAAGNVVTVEPGVYLPGLGGIRIEDLVIVRDDGPEVLTGFTKELATVS